MLLLAILALSVICFAPFLAWDIYTQEDLVAERKAKRDKQVYMSPTQLFPRTARNISRHRRIY